MKYPEKIRARCPMHGPQDFDNLIECGNWFVCPGFFDWEKMGVCNAYIGVEDMTPDGGDVRIYRD